MQYGLQKLFNVYKLLIFLCLWVVECMEKIRIVVCDDDPNDQKYYMDLCRMLAEKHNIFLEMKAYSTGESLLFDLGEPSFLQSIDILQIEIDMADMDGIKVAKAARRMGYNGVIVFLTRSATYEYYETAFDINATNYVRKGSEHLKRIEKVFVDTVNTAKKLRREYIILRCAGERRRIDIADIKYFEIMKYRIAAYYGDDYFEFISTMGKLESELLGRGFVRIHRAYMVSLDHVQSYTYNTVTLFDGSTLPVGRTYAASFKSAIEKWQQ